MTVLPPLVLELRTKFQESYADIKKTGHEVDELNAKTEGGMSRTQKAFTGAATVGKAALFGIAGAAAAVGVESLKLGTEFQESTTQLVTGAGESEENIGKVRKGLLDMAPAVGMGPDALAKAMFLVESAGFHGAAGLNVMKAAAEGAKIGGADATTVANGLTTALTDYHLPASQAADVTSKLVATVAAGKTNMGDLSGALAAVLPTASAAKVGLDQVLGAMGTMTGEGISAQQSAQDLAGTIRALGNPSSVATKAMAQMGINSIDVAKNLGKKGLTGTLDELTQAVLHHMGPAGLVLQSSFNQSKLAAQSAQEMLKQLPPSLQKLGQGYLDGTVTQKQWMAALKDQPALAANLGRQFATTAKRAHGFADDLKSGSGSAKTFNALMSDMTGGATGLATTLALTGGNMKTFKGNVDTIGHASAEAGGHVKGWEETQKDFAVQMAQAKAGVEAMGVKIGLALIPVVQKAITVGTKWSDYLIAHKPLLYAIAGVVGGALTLAITAYVAQLVIAGAQSVIQFGKMLAAGTAWAARTAASFAVVAARMAAQTGLMIARAAVWSASMLASAATTAAGWVASAATMVASGVAWAASIIASAATAAAGWLASMAVMVASSIASAAAIIAPFLPLILTIGAIGVAAYLLYRNWGTVWGGIKKISVDAWHWAEDIFHNKITQTVIGLTMPLLFLAEHWRQVWSGMEAVGLNIWHRIDNGIVHPLELGIRGIGVLITDFERGWSRIWHGIGDTISFIWNQDIQPVIQLIEDAVSKVAGAVGTVSRIAGSISGGIGKAAGFLGFDEGGRVPGAVGAPMLAIVHGGEYVVSNDMQAGRKPIDNRIFPAGFSAVGTGGGSIAPVRASGGPAGGGDLVVKVFVAGHVTTDRDLVEYVKTELQRQSLRSNTAYQPTRR